MPNRRKAARTKRLHGTERRDRRPKKDYSSRLRKPPKAPKTLSGHAKAAWRRIMPAIVGIGAATSADLPALELLASILGTEAEAREILAAEGLTVATADGGRKSHPAMRVAETARAQAVRLLAEFGLTPRGRQSVDTAPLSPAGGGDAFDRFLAEEPEWPGSLDAYLATDPSDPRNRGK